MNTLIIYAHPNPASFSSAIKETIVKSFKAKGSEVTVRDLYATNFNPILSGSDLQQIHSGSTPADIKVEQALITKADNLVFIYPIWWTGLPAMVKGYIDRVFSYGFSYIATENGIEGQLKGKKVIIATPHGTPRAYYEPTGMWNSLMQTQDKGIFEFCGIEVSKHFFFPMMGTEQIDREGYLKEVETFVEKF
ncbi:MAG: NAD(P)H-dependent oxidoreductase [Bacteroidota bacterium]